MSLRADTVALERGGRLVLDAVSCELCPGELVAVLGPNAAGKSTLLAALAGDLTPRRGAVTLDEKPLGLWGSVALARRRAVVLQSAELVFDYTALELVLLGRLPHSGGAPTERERALARRTLESLGVGALAERSVLGMSGGERQRVQVARALVQIARLAEEDTEGDRYLLLDEPSASLDLAEQARLLGVARDVTREGVGGLVVLHDLNLAAAFVDRIVVLHRGRVYAEGAPRDVLTPALINEVYGVSAVVMEHPAGARPLVVPWVDSGGRAP